MKNFIITVILALFTHAFYAQNAFDKFDGQDDVTSVIVNKKMFDIMSKVKVDASDKETQQYMNLIKKLDNLKVFKTENPKVEAEMRVLAEKYIKTANLEELMRINDSGKNVKIYIKSTANDTNIKELFMFIDGSKNEETVLLSLTGNFDLNEIAVLTDKMKLPGGTDLKKASKGKK
ncbi:DUF4252 domain-containing protein [Flavobacterium pectinovorum]|uniref:DUF4252 domain-containing protein n=1 Tax=Flavobacterium pectinovorum TaxID=29533 RepID=UPI001FAC1A39|nr:DUF4252 domain-containing protein [Flavobacterium pectinovorum]MCI9844074.1 DUF4252 domain-containing protein [Flavobacterium pectinovorum]